MHQKNDANIRTFFRNAFVEQLHHKSENYFWKLEGFIQESKVSFKKWKASSKECWVHAHISLRSTEQLRLRIFLSCICVFESCVCNDKAEQQWKGFSKRTSFLLMRTVTWVTMLAPQRMLVVNIVQSTTGCSTGAAVWLNPAKWICPKSCADEFYLCG